MSLDSKLVGKALRSAADTLDPPASTTQPAPSVPASPSSPAVDPIPVPSAPTSVLNFTRPHWLGEWSGDVWSFVNNVVTQAAGKLPLFVGYNIPGRDNGNYSRGGLHSAAEFYAWYGKIADAIGTASAWVIVEPDALGLSPALDQGKRDERFSMLQGVIDALNAKPNVKIWLDASTWIDPPKMAEMLKKFKGIDGFSCNVSGYLSTQEVMAWAEEVSKLTGLKYIIDTSRNGLGNPHKPAWCNVTDTKIGVLPTTATPSKSCEAFVWAKVPGESDGLKINGHDQDGQQDRHDIPTAGGWWQEFYDAISTGNWTAFKAKYKV